ncbi:MAG TPA: glycoside hydrolase family 13 protein [Firmicutes bacterium]|nr:glycoside hydrolase family 13 protein [Bacillota bacterium]
MEPASLFHTPWPPYVQGTRPDNLRVLLKARRNDIRAAYVVYGDRYQHEMNLRATMTKVGTDEYHDYFIAPLPLTTGRYKYLFYIEDVDGGEAWFSDAGLSTDMWNTRVFQMPHVAALQPWSGPDWVQDAICYQVFVDRFRNGNNGNDPPKIQAWDSQPTLDTRLGGDLDGIIEALPYLKDLGVDLLYLTPIFAAPSGHKYDTVDYYKIDPEFGDHRSLTRLTGEAHKLGIRIILDGAFNHCGPGFFAFRDCLEKGAASPYRDWFYIHSFPVTMNPPNYETFGAAIPEMPKLRLSNPETRQYFIDVATYWIREADIDGWRLDVANEIDLDFLREMRNAVKKIKPDAYIVGEIWHGAEPWLRGDTLDGVTAYPWRDAGLAFFSGWRTDAAWMSGQLTKHYCSARPEALLSSLNLLGSHDTPRYLELMGGDFNKARLLVAYQMTSPGVPQIYYGDEVGMRGWSDPECRRGMAWDPACRNEEMLGYYKYLINLRRKYPALRRGYYCSLWQQPGDPMWGMLRLYPNGNVAVLFNTAWHERKVDLPGGWLKASDEVELVTLTGWARGHNLEPEQRQEHNEQIEQVEQGRKVSRRNGWRRPRRLPVSLTIGPQSAVLLAPKQVNG